MKSMCLERLARGLAAGLVCVMLSSGSLPAQEFRATLSGIVRDPSGAVIPQAHVTAVKQDSGQTYTATSNGQGFYTIPYLIPGVYQVTVEANGFRKSVHSDVPLTVAQKEELDFALQVGSAVQEVTVTAAPTVVQKADASAGTTMVEEQVQNLPLNGRQVYMLMYLTPGVMFNQTQFGSTGYSGTRGWDANNNYTMGGGWNGYNQFLLNGSPVITDEADGWAGGWYMAPNEDAIQEFKIMDHTYDAEYGRTLGGVVNTTLKAGGNAYHGTLFDYYVNSVFNSNTFTSNLGGGKKGLDITNQYGGTFGGPIMHNKLFVFGSYEGYHQIIPFPVIASTLPSTVKILADGSIDFSGTGFQLFDPLTTHKCTAADKCAKSQTYARNPFPNDIIPGPNTALPAGILSRVNPGGLAVMQLFPAANVSTGNTNNYLGSTTLTAGKYRYFQPMVRVDYNFAEATRMYGTFAWQRGHEHRNHQGFPYPIAEGELDSERDFIEGILDVTHIFSPRTLIDVQGSFGRFHQDFPNGPMVDGLAKPITPQQLGLTMPNVPTSTQNLTPEICVSSYPCILGNSISQQLTNNFDFRPVLTHVRGRHSLRFGGEMEDIQYANFGVGRPNGQFSFNSGFTQDDPFHQGHCPLCGKAFNTDGYSFAGLALGDPSGGFVDWNQTMFETWHYYAAFVHDDFRFKRNLTLNLGLRWDVQTSPTERYNRIDAGFCFTCINPDTNNATFQANIAKAANIAAWNAVGVTVPGTLYGGLLFAGVSGPRAPYWNYLSQWQPRIGVAWAVRPKTVIRFGYGIFYAIQNQHDVTTGFSQRTSFTNSLDGGLTPSGYYTGGAPFPTGAIPNVGSSLGLLTNIGNGVSYDWRTRRIPNSQQWSFGIQQELPSRILLDVAYAGNYNRNLTMGLQWDHMSDAQQAACLANNLAGNDICDRNVPNPFYGALPTNSTLGSSKTLQAWRLMRGPDPEFDGVFENTNPNATASWNALEVKFVRNVGNGLTLLSAFTYEKEFERNHWLNNGSFHDTTPIREVAYFDRTLIWNWSAVWWLPVGTGRRIFGGAHGFTAGLLNHWNVDWAFNLESGRPTGMPDLYFLGPGGAPLGCTNYNIWVPQKSWGQWFNNDVNCWARRPNWSRRVMPDRVNWVRDPYEPQLNMALQKRFKLTERFALQFRGELFNLTNTPIFPGPDTNISHQVCGPTSPTCFANLWSGFGTINLSQQNFPRQGQVALKLIF